MAGYRDRMSEKYERPHLTTFTFLGFQLNAFAEDGNDTLTFADVYEGLDNGTLWSVIKKRHPNMDVSIFNPSLDKTGGMGMIEALREAAEGMRERERKKYGVESSGLALLMAYLLEAIQQGYWLPGYDKK